MSLEIFKCRGREIYTVPDGILEELGIAFEDANKDAFKMAALSKKAAYEGKYCRVPFCHTVEAEAFGSSVVFDKDAGTRIRGYAIGTIEGLNGIKKIDPTSGRIGEVLKAVTLLKSQGKSVILDVTGPVTIATSVMDSKLFFASLRKEKESIISFLKIIEDSISDYIKEACEAGADIISYADPVGTIDIIGPRVYKEISGQISYNILKRAEGLLKNTMIHMCGKTSSSLEYAGFLESSHVETDGSTYFEAIESFKKDYPELKFLGHECIKAGGRPRGVTYCILKEMI